MIPIEIIPTFRGWLFKVINLSIIIITLLWILIGIDTILKDMNFPDVTIILIMLSFIPGFTAIIASILLVFIRNKVIEIQVNEIQSLTINIKKEDFLSDNPTLSRMAGNCIITKKETLQVEFNEVRNIIGQLKKRNIPVNFGKVSIPNEHPKLLFQAFISLFTGVYH